MGTHGNCYKVVSNAKPLLNRVPLHDIGQPVQLLSTCTFTVSHVLLLCYTGDVESILLAPDAFDGTATPTAKGKSNLWVIPRGAERASACSETRFAV
jgi:hypothetical protein